MISALVELILLVEVSGSECSPQASNITIT